MARNVFVISFWFKASMAHTEHIHFIIRCDTIKRTSRPSTEMGCTFQAAIKAAVFWFPCICRGISANNFVVRRIIFILGAGQITGSNGICVFCHVHICDVCAVSCGIIFYSYAATSSSYVICVASNNGFFMASNGLGNAYWINCIIMEVHPSIMVAKCNNKKGLACSTWFIQPTKISTN